MRLNPSLSATLLPCALMWAAIAAPALAWDESAPFQLAQAAPAGPPSSGWNAPGAAPQAAPAAQPPNSGWAPPAASKPGTGLSPVAPAPAAAAPAAAAPAAPAPGSWNSSGAGPQRDCGGEFLPLRAEAEKKAAAIKAAAATKKQPVVCAAFKNFAAAEAKVVKYVEDHGAECRIPPDAVKAMKGNHAKTLEIRTKVCDTAAAPAPRAPSLSDALGTSRVPSAPVDNPVGKRSGSTFDTLTGNSLNR
jgi:hypothetical protein